MKKLFFLFFALVAIATGSRASVVLNSTNFPDAAFRVYVSNLTGVDIGGTISDSKLEAVTSIDVRDKKILDLKGIEYFTKITELNCSNNQLTSLDVSKNTALGYLYCSNNKLISLNVSKNTALFRLECYKNQLTSLDVSKNTELYYLYCHTNSLTSLNVSNNTNLHKLGCGYNQLTDINVLNNSKLTELNFAGNQVTSINVSKCTELEELDCRDNSLTSLVLSNNTALETLCCQGNQLTALDLTKNTAIEYIQCQDNQLTSLELNTTALYLLYCQNNQLTSLDLSKCTPLETLYCYDNSLTTLKLSPNNTKLKSLEFSRNNLSSIDLSNKIVLENLRCSDNNLTSLNLSDCELLEKLVCSGNQLEELDLSKNVRLTRLSCQNNYLTYLNLENNSFLTSADINPQASTRKFQEKNNCWTLYVGTTDASRISDLYIRFSNENGGVEGSTPPVSLLDNNPGWMVVSDDLEKVPLYVSYKYNVNNTNITDKYLSVKVYYEPTPYNLWVGGTQVNDVSKDNIDGYGKLKYNPSTKTLSLKNSININGEGRANDGTKGYGAGIYSEIDGLTIDVVDGSSTVTGADECYGIYLRGKTTIKGEGELISRGYTGVFMGSNSADLTVDGNVMLQAEGSKTYGLGGYVRGFAGNINYYTTLTVKGTAKVLAKGELGSVRNWNDLVLEDNHAITSPTGAVWNADKHAVCDASGNPIAGEWVLITTKIANPADVNKDGTVDSADIVAVIKEMPDGDKKADVNNDGAIDSADIVAVIKAMK